MKKKLALLMALLMAFSINNYAQGFVNGAVITYKSKNGSRVKAKFITFKDTNSKKPIGSDTEFVVDRWLNDVSSPVKVLFKDYVKITGGKDVGNNECQFTFTRKDGKSFKGRLSCYFFGVVLEDMDGFAQTTYKLRDIAPLTVVSGGSSSSTSGTIICPYCGKPIKIDAHK